MTMAQNVPLSGAVIVSTPQHLHAECFTAALDAGKGVRR